MDFAAFNYPSIVLAAIAAQVVGAIYYMTFGKAWMKAARLDPSAMSKSRAPFIISFIAELFLALVLYIVLDDITFAGSFSEDFDVVSSVTWSVIFWAGFVATTLIVNHRYQALGWSLTVIDAVHWLLVFIVMGAVLGWFGLAETGLLNGALTI